MSLIDSLKDGVQRFFPAKSGRAHPSTSMSGGIGSGHGMVPFEDDMIVSKPTIVVHSSQIFFSFLALACMASVASFQAKWGVGPSGLSGFSIFISLALIALSLFMLLIPVFYEKYDKFVRLARALKEVRVGFILTGTGLTASFLIAFILTISAWTQPGCKNPANDPNQSKGDQFKNDLSGWCNTKKAGAIFFWLTALFWLLSLGLLIRDLRDGRLERPRDPPFTRPPTDHGHVDEEDEGDEESAYHAQRATTTASDNSNATHSPFADSNRYEGAASRPSMDAYGAFSDPAPSGFGSTSEPPVLPEVDVGPRVSRTMQYADPYAAVRAQIAAGGTPSEAVPPPSYDSYQGYR